MIIIKTLNLSSLRRLTFFLSLIILSILTWACQGQEVKPDEFVEINRFNVEHIDEILTIQGEPGYPIAAMIIQTGSEKLRFVQSGEASSIQTWDIVTQEKLSQTTVGSINSIGATFSQDGTVLASLLNEASSKALSSRAGYGFQVIDAETGETILTQEDNALSLALTFNGNWLLVGGNDGYRLWSVTEQKSILSVVSGGQEHGGVAAVTTNRDNSRAVFDLSGQRIEFYALNLNTKQKPDGTHFLFTPSDKAVAIQFSPDDKWLVRLGGSSLTFFYLVEIDRLLFDSEEVEEIYKMETLQEKWEAMQLLNEEVETYTFSKTRESINTGDLTISPNGDLLAIGTKSGWELWSVESQELLMQHEAEEVYALAFSPDGRWFAWGDAQGVVHIWGIRQ